MHEQAVRESKDFMVLINKIKQYSQQRGNNGFDELLKECNQAVCGGNRADGAQSKHPVFVEIGKYASNNNDQTNTVESLKPWSEENRKKLNVLQL